MKKYFFLILFLWINTPVAVLPNENLILEVYYFHADQRCESDLQIEKECKQVIETVFEKEINENKVIFHVINFMDPENKDISEKFEIGWSTLLINKTEGNQEEIINLNDFAFTNIPANPSTFRTGLENQIKQLLE
jgi:hypothetical protein